MAETVLEAENLSMRFGGVVAVNHVNLKLRRNELMCLIGPNGAGKTSFFRCLTGQYRPSEGDVWIAGQKTTGLRMHEIARLGVGLKTQVPSLMNGLSVYENLWLGARRRHEPLEANRRVDQLLEELNVSEMARNLTGQLAHGVRQVVEIGVALSTEPWLLLLDEPAGGLTHDEAMRIGDLVKALAKRITVVVVEHDMAFVRHIAQRVVVFHQGSIIADGDTEKVLSNPRVREVYLGSKVQ